MRNCKISDTRDFAEYTTLRIFYSSSGWGLEIDNEMEYAICKTVFHESQADLLKGIRDLVSQISEQQNVSNESQLAKTEQPNKCLYHISYGGLGSARKSSLSPPPPVSHY